MRGMDKGLEKEENSCMSIDPGSGRAGPASVFCDSLLNGVTIPRLEQH